MFFYLLYSIGLSAVANLRKLSIGFATSVCQRVWKHAMCFRVIGIYFVRGTVFIHLKSQ